MKSTNEEDFDHIMHVNVKRFYNCTRTIISHMKNNNNMILNMASITGSSKLTNRFTYSMNKNAILTITYSMTQDYLAYNIHCNCISPARVHTPFMDNYLKKNYPRQEQEIFEKLSKAQPIGRINEPKEVTTLALFLYSDE